MNFETHFQEMRPILSVLVNKQKDIHFGLKLKKWRKAANGMTQEELATAVGVHPSYISNLERNFSGNTKSGKPKPSEALVEKFSRVLQVDIDEIRVAAGYAPKNLNRFLSGSQLGELVSIFNDLSERDQSVMIDLAKSLSSRKLEIGGQILDDSFLPPDPEEEESIDIDTLLNTRLVS